MVATARIGLNKQPVGDNVNTWGSNLNEQVIELLDEAVAGVETIALTGSRALTSTNFVTNEARNSALVFTDGGLTAAPTITIPAREKSYIVINQTTFALTFSCGGAPVSLPAGRRGNVVCDGSALILLEPVAAAAAVTQAIADQAAVSAQTAMTSASTATTRRDQALAARDETYTARDLTLGYRDTTLGYRNAAASSASAAAASAAGVNLPAVSASDAGKALTVKSDGSGYEPTSVTVAKATAAQRRALTDNTVVNTPASDASAMAVRVTSVSGSFVVGLNFGFNQAITLIGNAIAGLISAGFDGLPVVLYFIQDATGGRTLSFNATYHKFPGGIVPTLSTAAGAVDRLSGMCRNRDGTLVIEWSGIDKDIK